jgi:hypothetical protein
MKLSILLVDPLDLEGIIMIRMIFKSDANSRH